MEKQLVEKIVTGDSEKDIEIFDRTVSGLLVKKVSSSFTKNVMVQIQPSTQGADGQIWWIVIGMITTACIWVVGGFGNAALEIELPRITLPAIEMGPVIKGIGFVNIILILLLLDRYFQRRKKPA